MPKSGTFYYSPKGVVCPSVGILDDEERHRVGTGWRICHANELPGWCKWKKSQLFIRGTEEQDKAMSYLRKVGWDCQTERKRERQ